jgi:uncharacterized protein YqiB (DUF1249 family)
LHQEKTCVQLLQDTMQTNAKSSQSLLRLQNIQNYHNMMKVGRPNNVLVEWITDEGLQRKHNTQEWW